MFIEQKNYCQFPNKEAAKKHCNEVLSKNGKPRGYEEHDTLGWVSYWVSNDWIDNKMEKEDE